MMTEFQCSSASRKFLNQPLQPVPRLADALFQCSSASRKFLNRPRHARRQALTLRFSALQRAENFSIVVDPLRLAQNPHVSVLFSEPKISQYNSRLSVRRNAKVSVLFSEPKISQFRVRRSFKFGFSARFQCSSASRKFLNHAPKTARGWIGNVSVLFSEPKISQSALAKQQQYAAALVSVLFSEPKISQSHV